MILFQSQLALETLCENALTPLPERKSVPAWLVFACKQKSPGLRLLGVDVTHCQCHLLWAQPPQLPRARSIQLRDPGGCSSCFQGGSLLKAL